MLVLSFAAALAFIFFPEPDKQLYSYFPYRLWQFLAGCYAAHLYKNTHVSFRGALSYSLAEYFIFSIKHSSGHSGLGEENVSMGFSCQIR